jgi:hypothetical protein
LDLLTVYGNSLNENRRESKRKMRRTGKEGIYTRRVDKDLNERVRRREEREARLIALGSAEQRKRNLEDNLSSFCDSVSLDYEL